MTTSLTWEGILFWLRKWSREHAASCKWSFRCELSSRDRPLAELAKRIEEARRRRQRLSTPPMVPVSRDKDLPLSFSQQRLWFLDQYEPNSSVYNIPSALRLRGSLNIGALEQSLNEIIRRHESLRTTFSMVDGEPVQVIAPSLSFSFEVVDLRDHPEGEREEEARRLVREEARRPFDLAQGPLFRSKLLRLGEDDHVLLLTMHHIVSDGWSMGMLYRELSVLYQAFVNGEPSPLPELSDPVCGFCRVAAGVAAGRSIRQTAFLLEKAARGDSCGTESTDGSAAASGAESSGSTAIFRAV